MAQDVSTIARTDRRRAISRWKTEPRCGRDAIRGTWLKAALYATRGGLCGAFGATTAAHDYFKHKLNLPTAADGIGHDGPSISTSASRHLVKDPCEAARAFRRS
jgi:hypothetical protein